MTERLQSLLARSFAPEPQAIRPRLLSRFEDSSAPATNEPLDSTAQVESQPTSNQVAELQPTTPLATTEDAAAHVNATPPTSDEAETTRATPNPIPAIESTSRQPDQEPSTSPWESQLMPLHARLDALDQRLGRNDPTIVQQSLSEHTHQQQVEVTEQHVGGDQLEQHFHSQQVNQHYALPPVAPPPSLTTPNDNGSTRSRNAATPVREIVRVESIATPKPIVENVVAPVVTNERIERVSEHVREIAAPIAPPAPTKPIVAPAPVVEARPQRSTASISPPTPTRPQLTAKSAPTIAIERQPSETSTPQVTVSIGRVEVRSTQSAKPPTAPPRRPSTPKVMTLDEYLRRNDGAA